jgi:hypothetical protein
VPSAAAAQYARMAVKNMFVLSAAAAHYARTEGKSNNVPSAVEVRFVRTARHCLLPALWRGLESENTTATARRASSSCGRTTRAAS